MSLPGCSRSRLTNGPMAPFTNSTPGGASAGGACREKTNVSSPRVELRPQSQAHVVGLPAQHLRVDRLHEGVHAVEALGWRPGRQPLEIAVGTRDIAVGTGGDVDDDLSTVGHECPSLSGSGSTLALPDVDRMPLIIEEHQLTRLPRGVGRLLRQCDAVGSQTLGHGIDIICPEVEVEVIFGLHPRDRRIRTIRELQVKQLVAGANAGVEVGIAEVQEQADLLGIETNAPVEVAGPELGRDARDEHDVCRRLITCSRRQPSTAADTRLRQMPARRGDQPVRAKGPLLKPADPHRLAGPARAGVGPGQRPAVDGLVAFDTDAVHRDDHVREGRHEALRRRGDCRPADGRGAVVDLQRTAFAKVLRDAGGVLTAPRGGVFLPNSCRFAASIGFSADPHAVNAASPNTATVNAHRFISIAPVYVKGVQHGDRETIFHRRVARDHLRSSDVVSTNTRTWPD